MMLFLGVIFLAATLYFGREVARANHVGDQLKAGRYEVREAHWFKSLGLRCLASISMLLTIWCMAWAFLPTTMQESWDFASGIIAHLRR